MALEPPIDNPLGMGCIRSSSWRPSLDLWNSVAEVWLLPPVLEVQNTGHEWLLHLVGDLPEFLRLHLLMLLWRICLVCNEIIHYKPAPPTDVSKRFFCSYVQSILAIQDDPLFDPVKGKAPVSEPSANMKIRDGHAGVGGIRWMLLEPGWVKLNTDGSFVQADMDRQEVV